MTGIAEPLGRDERGIALLMVLWVFMVLTVLVAEFSRSMRDDATAAQNLAEEVQAHGVAMTAINTAIYRTMVMHENHTADDDVDVEETDQWLPDGTWHDGQYGAGSYSVRMIDEGGKIPLNRADETLLRKVFENLGLGQDAQESLVDAILDWRDPDSLRRLHGAEADYYLKLPTPYRPKNGQFDSVDELLFVRGVTRELFFGTPRPGLGHEADLPPVPLKEIFSVFSRTANINVRNAPAAVLRVLLGGQDAKKDVDADVEEVIAARTSDPESALALVRAKLGDPLARRLVDQNARTLAIDARAAMQAGQVQARVGAVVDFGDDGDGFHVVRWFDRLPAF